MDEVWFSVIFRRLLESRLSNACRRAGRRPMSNNCKPATKDSNDFSARAQLDLLDASKTWGQVANTMQAKTTMAGLPVATTVGFRYRVTTKAGMGDWSLPTSFLVK